jgi:hypothetical protein
MKRLITFTLVFTLVCCTSCKEKKPDGDGGNSNGTDTTSVTPTVKKYVMGSYYDEDGVRGIVFDVDKDSLHGIIVSLDETTASWAKTYVETGAFDIADGTKNVEKIKEKGIADYPAFDWCDKKNTGKISGWYLPAQNELSLIVSKHKQLQDSLVAHAGTMLDASAEYWSSTERSGSTTHSLAMSVKLDMGGNPYAGTVDKAYSRKVRAIYVF